jgi:hypothetical protein
MAVNMAFLEQRQFLDFSKNTFILNLKYCAVVDRRRVDGALDITP